MGPRGASGEKGPGRMGTRAWCGPRGQWADHTGRGPRGSRVNPGHTCQPEKSQEPGARSTDVYAHTCHTHAHLHTCHAHAHVHTRTHATHAHQPRSGPPSCPPQSPAVHTEEKPREQGLRLLTGITGRRDSRPGSWVARGNVSPEPVPPPSQPPQARGAHPARAGSHPHCPWRCPCHHRSAASAAGSPCTAG